MAVVALDTALSGAIVLVVIALLSATFTLHPSIAVPLLLLVEWANGSNVTLGIMVGPLHVYAGDVFSAALLVSAFMRWLRRRDTLKPPEPLVVLLALVLFGIARGAATFGIQTSVDFGREMLAMSAAAIFFSTVRVTSKLILTLRNWLLVTSAIWTLAAIRFWILHGFGTYATTGVRALDGLQALVILETTVLVILFPLFRGPVLRLVVPLTGVVLVLLSIQRTVWVAGIVAIAILVVARQRNRSSRSLAGRRIVAAMATALVVLLVAAGPSGVTSSLTAGVQQTSVTSNSTFSWRLQGWSTLVSRQIDGSTVDLVIGSPTGTGYTRVIAANVVTVAPHSEYVSALDLTGLLGVILLVWVYAAAFIRCRKRLRLGSHFASQTALLFIVLLALQLTYFIGYSEGALVGLMLGLAWGLIGGSEHEIIMDGTHSSVSATE